MPDNSDLIGKTYGKLFVLAIVENSMTAYSDKYVFRCKCSCGNICYKSKTYLTVKHYLVSCGCNRNEVRKQIGLQFRLNLIGQKFSRLTVISISDYKTKYKRNVHWLCRCDCGNVKVVRGDSLLSGNTTSCGCRSRGSKTHGTVYGIYDIDDNLKYVGQTTAFSLQSRLRKHYYNPCGQVGKWLSSLNYKPTIKPLISDIKIENLDMMERQLIHLITSEYHPLLNIKFHQ